MADDELQMFDPSLKKKKKKKAFDPDGLLDKPTTEPEVKPEPENTDNAMVEESGAVDMDEYDFTKLKKKPKKKKKDFDMSEVSTAVEAVETPDGGGAETGTVAADGECEEKPGGEEDMDSFINFASEKKKKKKKAKFDDIIAEKTTSDTPTESGDTWVDSGVDYTYDELLKRVSEIIREKNPDMVAGEKKRLVMKPPQVVKIGAKKTSFANFTDICKSLHRQPKHLLAFLMAELGTSGSIDGNNQLIIKGRFQSKQIESVLRNYIKEYVSCHTCKSPDTILQKDTRLYFLHCETCRSWCSVSSIKSGFQAVTGKRAAIRAKTA